MALICPKTVDSSGAEPSTQCFPVDGFLRLLKYRHGVTLMIACLLAAACTKEAALMDSRVELTGTYLVDATYIGSLAVPSTSEQACGLNVPAKHAEYRVRLENQVDGIQVEIVSFGCEFRASVRDARVLAEDVSCALSADSPLHALGVEQRRVAEFEFEPRQHVFRLLYSDLARGVARDGDTTVRYCGIVEASQVDRVAGSI